MKADTKFYKGSRVQLPGFPDITGTVRKVRRRGHDRPVLVRWDDGCEMAYTAEGQSTTAGEVALELCEVQAALEALRNL